MSLYNALKEFRDSHYSFHHVKEADEDNIVRIERVNENNRGKSLVKLKFYDDEYRKIMMGDGTNYESENNISLYEVCGSYYSSEIFVGCDWGYEEVREGYVFYYFNEENINLLNKIAFILDPTVKKYTVNNQNNNQEEVGNLIWKHFQSEMEDIACSHASYYDDTLKKGLIEYVDKKLCNKLVNFGIIEKVCFREYLTTVDLLLKFWDSTESSPEETFLTVLKKFAEDQDLILDEELYEDYYSYWDNENFDKDGFNRDVERELEKIYEKLEETIGNETIEERRKFISLLNKIGIDPKRWSSFPKEKKFGDKSNNKFSVNGFDDDGRIIVFYSESGNFGGANIARYKMTYDQFLNFLYHPELF